MSRNPNLAWSSWEDFLANAAAGSTYSGNDSYERSHIGKFYVKVPPIKLFCKAECQDERYFDDTIGNAELGTYTPFFFRYFCRHCHKDMVHIALIGHVPSKSDEAVPVFEKIGHSPPFGPVTPARLVSLIGPDKDLFLKGRRSESQGLGIGAFTYYRRVIENQKNRLLNEVIRVAQSAGSPTSIIDTLEAAKNETQFDKAMKSVKDAIPESLRINGHNPLVLLYSALSEGVHELSDEECLARAQDVRVVLGELARRAASSLADDAELKASLNRLTQRKTP